MKPVEICKTVLGNDLVAEIIDKLSSPQIKSVLKEGGLKVKLSSGFVSQSKKRGAWAKRILGALEQDDQDVAGELLQQWLLNHHRAMLVDYLDALGVKHTDGETDDSFLLSGSQDSLRDAALGLMRKYPPVEVRAYLYYIAYQQRSTVFEDWDGLDG